MICVFSVVCGKIDGLLMLVCVNFGLMLNVLLRNSLLDCVWLNLLLMLYSLVNIEMFVWVRLCLI